MLRTFVCASLAVLLCAGIGLGAGKGAGKGKGKGNKGNQVHGKVVKVDTSRNTLTLTVKKKQESSDKEVTVTDQTKFVTYSGDQKSEVAGKAGLKDVKAGDRVRIKLDASGAANEIAVNPPHKKKPAK
jgi:hypothetical protein